MTKPIEPRQCPRCLAAFEPKKRNHVYCVPACKKKAHQEEYGLGGVMLKMGIFDRAGLRRFYAVLDALGSPRPSGTGNRRQRPVYGRTGRV